MKLITSIVVIAIIWPALPDVAARVQQVSAGSVAGIVKDRDGAVVVGARVLLIQTQQAVLRSTRSSADGRFRFDSVSPGTYEIRVSRADFSNQLVPVEVVSARI